MIQFQSLQSGSPIKMGVPDCAYAFWWVTVCVFLSWGGLLWCTLSKYVSVVLT
jgi:hypothetical protein